MFWGEHPAPDGVGGYLLPPGVTPSMLSALGFGRGQR
jgi:hypothetical protein